LQDPVSGLVYLRARHYHPVLGRFLQRDSFGGFVKQPQSLNRYSYVYNNPLMFIDPSGHYADQVLLTHFGCESWSCIEARFQNRGTHAGLWGWLDVLLRAEDGDEISTYAFYGGTGALLTGRFVTVGGRIMVAGVTMILDFSVCPFAPEISDLWEEETFAKTALMGSWLPGHNAFYKGPYGVSVHDQQYQDCRHEDCVVAPTIDAVGMVGAGMVLGAPVCGPAAPGCAAVGAQIGTIATGAGIAWAFYQTATGDMTPEDVAVTGVTTIVGVVAKDPLVDLAANLAQFLWDIH
jgi:RHS repeat-associated protein